MPIRPAHQDFDAQFQIAFGENPIDGALLEFLGEFENVGQYGPQAFELSLQPIQLAALRVRGLFVTPAGKLFSEDSEKIPLFGVQLEAAFDDGIVEHIGAVAYRQQGRMVFLTVRQFAVNDGCDQRERGKRLPVGRGLVGQDKSPSTEVLEPHHGSGSERGAAGPGSKRGAVMTDFGPGSVEVTLPGSTEPFVPLFLIRDAVHAVGDGPDADSASLFQPDDALP